MLLPGPDRRVLGISLRVHNLRVAARAGATIVSAEALREGVENLAVIVPASTLIEVSLFPLPSLTEVTWLASGGSAAVLAGPANRLRQYAASLAAADGLPRRGVSPTAVFDVSGSLACRRTAWSVLQGSGKTTDGWVSRHFGRRISRVVSFGMLSMGCKPNHASALTLVVGLAAAALAVRPGHASLVGTGVLFQLASVLDGVDGEMARVTLTESDRGALIDTLVDQLTYLACFLGLTIGWIREGAGPGALAWAAAIAVALVLSLVRGGRFVGRHAPNASFAFIDRAVARAARDSKRAALHVAAATFPLLRRDAFATLFLLVAFVGYRELIPALVTFGIVFANVTLSLYHRELTAAAIEERLSA